MGLSVFMLPVAVMAMGQPPAVPEADSGGQNVEIRIGHDLVPLPFRLNLDPRARPPRSLTELVDRLYRALPQDRIDMFAAFHTDENFERVRARYDSTSAFWYGLYTIEILHEAGRVWGFTDRHFPLDRARRCVGDDFTHQVAIQIGIRRYYETGSGPQPPPPLVNRSGGYLMAYRVSRQLFALCDRLYSPGRVGRQLGRSRAR